MEGPRMIKYEKQYGFGGEKSEEKTATEIWQEIIKERKKKIIELPAILARGYFDHLIQYKEGSEPPTLEWKANLIEELIPETLRDVIMICEKVRDEQTRHY